MTIIRSSSKEINIYAPGVLLQLLGQASHLNRPCLQSHCIYNIGLQSDDNEKKEVHALVDSKASLLVTQ
jgi:hypothetical protein